MTVSVLIQGRHLPCSVADFPEEIVTAVRAVEAGAEVDVSLISGPVRAAIASLTSEFCLLINTDWGCDPSQGPSMLRPLLAGEADLVIGSRVLGGGRPPVVISKLASVVAKRTLTDIASGCIAFRLSLAHSIPLREDGIGLYAELPIKFAQRGARIIEALLTGNPRRTSRMSHSIRLGWTSLRRGLIRDVYIDRAASMLRAMEDAVRFNRWMADTVAPFLGERILEIGAGIGNLTRLLAAGTSEYVVTDIDPEYLIQLNGLIRLHTNVESAICDLSKPEHFEPFRGRMDTVVCLNVLEHIPDDMTGLGNIYSALRVGGRAIILVPQGSFAFGTFDEELGHCRRYSCQELCKKMQAAGFTVERVIQFNRATYPGWLLNGKVLRRRTLSRIQLALFDSLVPWLRRVDRFLPWPPTSLIAIGLREDPMGNRKHNRPPY